MKGDVLLPIPAGSLLTVTVDAWSSYTISGVFRALAEISPAELRTEWYRLHPDQDNHNSFDEARFLVWVHEKGLIEPVDCLEWHLGDFGDGYEMQVSKMEGKE